MYKRPVLITAISVLSGVLFIIEGADFLFAVPLALTPFIFYRRVPKRAVLLLITVILSFTAGSVLASLQLSQYEKTFEAINGRGSVTLRGTVIRKEMTAYGRSCTVALHGLYRTRILITTAKPLRTGSFIRITGTPEPPDPLSNPGCFDEASYYRSLSVVTLIKDAETENTGRDPVFPIRIYYTIMEALWLLKYRMQDVYTSILPGEEGPLLASLAIGTKSLLDPAVREMFQDAGISHVLAISGLHISIVGSVIYKGLKQLHIRKKTAAVLSSSVVFFYAVTISDSVSCRRAVLMYFLVMLSDIIGDGTDLITSLSAACIFISLTDPLSVTQTAFVLSFTAVCLMAVIVSPATECYRSYCVLSWENLHKEIKGNRYKPTAKDDLISSVISSFFIQVSMASITAKYFYSFPLLSCLLNVVILPFLPLLLCLGLLGGLIGTVFPAVSQVVLFPCHLLLYWYELTSSSYSEIPFSQIVTGDIPMIKICLSIAAVQILSCMLRHRIRQMFVLRFTRIPWKKQKVCPPFGDRKTLIAAAIISASIIVMMSSPAHHDEFALLNVYQGDGLLLTTSDGKAFMIDGGSTTRSDIGKNVLIPSLKYRGISSVEGWFITHLDEDHVSGLKELIEKDYPIKTVWLARYIEKDEKLASLLSLCRSHKVKVSYLNKGDILKCRTFSLETVFPDKESGFSGENENSLVTVIRLTLKNRRYRIICTGDIGKEQEEYLIKQSPDSLKRSYAKELLVLKSAHHGSNYSNCEQWLKYLDPDLILISAGKGNRYGHPGRETMDRITSLGIKSMCTIDTGQIRFRENGVSFMIH